VPSTKHFNFLFTSVKSVRTHAHSSNLGLHVPLLESRSRRLSLGTFTCRIRHIAGMTRNACIWNKPSWKAHDSLFPRAHGPPCLPSWRYSLDRDYRSHRCRCPTSPGSLSMSPRSSGSFRMFLLRVACALRGRVSGTMGAVAAEISGAGNGIIAAARSRLSSSFSRAAGGSQAWSKGCEPISLFSSEGFFA
jgi:hypothetical protein